MQKGTTTKFISFPSAHVADVCKSAKALGYASTDDFIIDAILEKVAKFKAEYSSLSHGSSFDIADVYMKYFAHAHSYRMRDIINCIKP